MQGGGVRDPRSLSARDTPLHRIRAAPTLSVQCLRKDRPGDTCAPQPDSIQRACMSRELQLRALVGARDPAPPIETLTLSSSTVSTHPSPPGTTRPETSMNPNLHVSDREMLNAVALGPDLHNEEFGRDRHTCLSRRVQRHTRRPPGVAPPLRMAPSLRKRSATSAGPTAWTDCAVRHHRRPPPMEGRTGWGLRGHGRHGRHCVAMARTCSTNAEQERTAAAIPSQVPLLAPMTDMDSARSSHHSFRNWRADAQMRKCGGHDRPAQ